MKRPLVFQQKTSSRLFTGRCSFIHITFSERKVVGDLVLILNLPPRSEEEMLKFMGLMNSSWVLDGHDIVTAFNLSCFKTIVDLGGKKISCASHRSSLPSEGVNEWMEANAAIYWYQPAAWCKSAHLHFIVPTPNQQGAAQYQKVSLYSKKNGNAKCLQVTSWIFVKGIIYLHRFDYFHFRIFFCHFNELSVIWKYIGQDKMILYSSQNGEIYKCHHLTDCI